MANEITALKEIDGLLNSIEKDLVSVNKELVKASKNARESAENFFDIKFPKELDEQLKQSSKFSKELNGILRERQRIQKTLISSQEKLRSAQSQSNKEVIKNRLELQKINRDTKEGIILNSKFASAYEKLSVKHRRAARTLKDLVSQQVKGKKETRALNQRIKVAQKEFNTLDKRIRKADQSANDFRRDVGKYKNAVRPVIGLVRGLAGAFGVYSAIQIGRSIFEDIKALDALDEALLKVTGSTQNLNKTKAFLSIVAEKNGVEIKSLTKEYTKYLAALKGTNLQGTKGEKIFSKVIKASAALGNSQDQTNGILNAFVQIISKGTVQAEELRGQLGDRLPGAVNIMARALGVGTEELNKMLENGELLADEVLPKFADELEKTFGLENVERIDTLVAAQNRLTNAWTEFVAALEDGQGPVANAYKSIVNVLGDVLGGLKLATQDFEQQLESTFDTSRAESYAAALREIDREVRASGKTQEEIAQDIFDANIDSTSSLSKQVKALKERRLELEEQKESLSIFNTVQRNGVSNEIEEINGKLKNLNISFAISEGQVSAAQKVLSEYAKSQFDASEETEKTTEKTKSTNKVIDGTIAAYRKLISELEKQKDSQATTTGQVLELESRIKSLKNAIKELKGELTDNGLEGAFNIEIGFDVPDDDEIINDLSSRIDQIKAQYQKDVDNFKISTDEKLEIASNFSSELGNLGNALFDRSVERIDAEIQENDRKTDSLLRNESLTDKERAQIEKGREARNEKLEQKRIETQQRQARFNKAISIAEIGINTAQSISETAASIPFPASIPFIALAAAQGALQLATVLATPIPQYEFGKPEGDNYSGPAIWGEKRKEIKFNTKSGLIEISPNKPTMTNVLKDDIIYPSEAAFNNGVGSSALINSAIMTSLYSENLDSFDTSKMFDRILSKYQGMMQSEIEKGLKRAKFNIYNQAAKLDVSGAIRMRDKVDV